MIGLLLRPMMGGGAAAMGLMLICGCCMYCRAKGLRGFWFCKKCLRCFGCDPFDDFDLMIMVHHVVYQGPTAKALSVRAYAGAHTVDSEKSTDGEFLQPLSLFVAQGSPLVTVELLDQSENLLATLKLDIMKQILDKNSPPQPETVFTMQTRGRVQETKIVLTLVASDADAERQAIADSRNMSPLVKQHMKNVVNKGPTEMTELEALKVACRGPLEFFRKAGKLDQVFAAVVGPPTSRRWAFCIWDEVQDFVDKKKPVQEVDLLRVQSIQYDPTRANVFIINYYDENRTYQRLIFQRVDRAREIWVDVLQILVTKARELRKDTKGLAQASQV